MKFSIDRTASRLSVQAFATGMLSFAGHNPTIGIRNFDGELGFTPESYEKAYVRVTVDLTNLDVLDEMKRDDRKKLVQSMDQDVLEVERFPSAAYESNEVTVQKLDGGLLQAHALGNLSFHGTTRREAIDARISDMGSMLRLSGGFSLRQTDYGIRPVSFAGGTLRLKDELKFTFELVVRGQEEAATKT